MQVPTTRTGTAKRRNKRPLAVGLIACAALTYLTGAYWGCGEYPPGPAEQDDIANGGAAAASGTCGNKKKEDLKNIWHGNVNTWIGDYRLFSYIVHTSWGYRPDRFPCSQPGLIRWRHSTPDFIPRASAGTVQVVRERWDESGGCYDGGRQCLTRRDIRVQWSVPVQGSPINGYVDGCIGTRIGPGGAHNRHVYDKESCASAIGRALARRNETPSDRLRDALANARHAYRKWDRADATIDDYVDRRTAKRIDRACVSGGLGSAGCRQTLWNAYSSLRPQMQRKAKREMAATARRYG